MDYDKTNLADNYDCGRDHGAEVLELWMRVVASYVNVPNVKTIVDLGCGTGRFSEVLAAYFDAEVIGVDPSKKMLERAEEKRRDTRVKYQVGSGEAIPVSNQSVDLIFMSMIFHHFEDPFLAARECRRVLREQGISFLRAGTYENIPSYPYVEFFPASRPILEDRLPKASFVRAVFASAGFREVGSEVVTQEIAPNHSAYAEKLAAGADSILISLSLEEFAAGMEALRTYAANVTDEKVFEPIDVFVFQ